VDVPQSATSYVVFSGDGKNGRSHRHATPNPGGSESAESLEVADTVVVAVEERDRAIDDRILYQSGSPCADSPYHLPCHSKAQLIIPAC
jgi:hypothetical protein